MQPTAKCVVQGASWTETFVDISRDAYSIAGVLVEPEAAWREAIVICGSLLDHRKHMYRDLAMLARVLAQAGIATLRFDYSGFGESAGQAEQADLASFVDDAEACLCWLRAERPASSISCIGVGLGAIIAAHAVARSEPTPLIACQPLWQIETIQRGPFQRKPLYDGRIVDVNGYRIGQRLYRQLTANEWRQNFPPTAHIGAPTLLMHVQDGPSADAAQIYQELLERSGRAVVVHAFRAARFWLSAELPLPVAEVCRCICEWLPGYG